jgi:hypothetical protein
MAGMYDKVDPKTGKTSKVRVGMTWDPATKRYKFGQGKVALIQLCDDKLIVLVHLIDMKGTCCLRCTVAWLTISSAQQSCGNHDGS